MYFFSCLLFFNRTAPTQIYPLCPTLSLPYALPLWTNPAFPLRGDVRWGRSSRERLTCRRATDEDCSPSRLDIKKGKVPSPTVSDGIAGAGALTTRGRS